MPWKNTDDPYCIWISEIILQQTRVDQGINYYLNFIKAFPDLKSLALANENEVLKLWEGLGYYSRARNLHLTAKFILQHYNGQFPDSYDKVISLKGIGEYTAAAVLSFAFNQCYAVVDGNVVRVLSRIFGIEKSVDDSAGKKYFTRIANELIDKTRPATFNQAIMNFGALQCVPKNPDCTVCDFNHNCFAFKNKVVESLPMKKKKVKTKQRYFVFEVIEMGTKILIEKRNNKDIWKGLFQYPMQEVSLNKFERLRNESKQTFLFDQKLTHQTLKGLFVVRKKLPTGLVQTKNMKWIYKNKLTDFAFPKMLREFNSIFLSSNFKPKKHYNERS